MSEYKQAIMHQYSSNYESRLLYIDIAHVYASQEPGQIVDFSPEFIFDLFSAQAVFL